jgi:hypothetical protein
VDVDATIWGAEVDLVDLFRIWLSTGTPMEISIAWLAFEREALDLEKIQVLASQFAQIMGEPQRVDEFDELVRRAMK